MRSTEERKKLRAMKLGSMGTSFTPDHGYAWKLIPYTAIEMRNAKPGRKATKLSPATMGKQAHVQLMRIKA